MSSLNDRLDRGRRAATAVWLARVASGRPGVVQRVAQRFGSLDAALDAPVGALRTLLAPRSFPQVGRRASRCEAADEAERETSRHVAALAAEPRPPEAWSSAGRLLVTYDDELYPPRLRSLFDPPPALFVAGDDAELRLRALAAATAVAIVGTRAPSAYGREMARLLGGGLARAGVVVVSGVALGIDVAAQLAAVEAAPLLAPGVVGLPRSVGVLGCGRDVVHPRSNAAAFRALRAHGLLLSEFWPGTPPSVWRFPARNRVIAGLSRAVVVVEGSRRSGSRITAELAVEAGREVLAVPGEAGRRLSEAPHHLLRHGAHLCEAADDVLAVLGLEGPAGAWVRSDDAGPDDAGGGRGPGDDRGAEAGDETAAGAQDATGAQTAVGAGRTVGARLAAGARAVLDALGDAPGSAEELAARLSLPARAVVSALSALEVEGLAARAAGGVYRRVR